MEDYMSAKITRLNVANFKRIEEVSVDLDGNVLIGGKNAQGKSSLLDAIWAGLSGGAAIPPDPVNHGKDRATIEIELDNGLVVQRTITPDRKHKLKILGREDAKTTPQRWLDDHIQSITLDPLAVLTMPAQKQADLLRELAGIDTTELDNSRSEAFEQRTEVGRRLRDAEAELKAHPDVVPGLPAERVSTQELSTQLQEAMASCAEFDKANDEYQRANARYREINEDIERTKKRLAMLEADLEATIAEGRRLRGVVDKWVKPDVDAIRNQIANASHINEGIASNAKRAKLEERVSSLREAHTGLTEVIASIDEEKAAYLAAAKWPLDGLSVGDSGVTFNGVPLEQASQAEQLRVCVALAASSRPDVGVVLVRDGSRLDEDSLRLLLTLVSEAGLQAFVERVGVGDAGAVVIENGSVK